MSPILRHGIPLALLALTGGAHPARAQVTQDYSTTVVNPFFVNEDTFTTTTTASSPTFNRPGLANVPGVTAPPTALSGGGTAVAYATHDFTPSQDATYRVSTTINSGYADPKASPNGTDNFVQVIYASDPSGKTATFNPTAPLRNAVLAYSQGASGDNYRVDLSGSAAYTFVNTGYYNANQTGPKLSVGTATTSIDRLDYGSTTFIPDAPDLYSTGSASQTLTLSGAGTVSAFNSFSFVGLDHPYLGDLTATLSHDGITVNLFNQVGADPTGNYGQGVPAAFVGSQTYTFANSGADLAKTAAATVDSYAADKYATYFPMHGGTFQSLDPLNAFDGTALAGDWTLTMVDNKYGDSGSFLGFSFNATSTPAVPEASTWVGMGIGCLTLVGLAFKRRRMGSTPCA